MKILPPERSLRAMLVIAQYANLLQELGLDSIAGVKRFEGELIKNHKGQRDILRVRGNIEGSELILFLKRNWKPYRKDGLRTLLRHGNVRSQSRVEWENSLALRKSGIAVAEPVAFGEQCTPLWEKFSFLITAAAPGEQTLETFLKTCRDQPLRRHVFNGLAKFVRQMHDSGLASPDLFTRHIFLSSRGKDPAFCLIDMARLDQRAQLSLRLRARDLAALNVTAPLRFVSTRERLLFLREYGSTQTLRRLIGARSNYLLKRRKFADFLAAD